MTMVVWGLRMIERTKNGIEDTKKVIEGQIEKGEIHTETFCAEIGRIAQKYISTLMFLTINLFRQRCFNNPYRMV